MKLEKLLPWLAVGGVGYLAMKALGGAKEAADKAAQSIANAYVRATSDPAIEVLGRVVLPDGQRVPLNDVAVKPDFTFMFRNVKYRLTGRRPDNDYDAVKV